MESTVKYGIPDLLLPRAKGADLTLIDAPLLMMSRYSGIEENQELYLD